MKYTKYLLFCLFIAICCPLITTHADFNGDIVYIHPDNGTELWLTRHWDGRNAHHIFTHSRGIDYLAVQKNGPYLLIIAHANVNGRFGRDIFLIDRTRPHAKARNLTQQRYGPIEYMDISRNGDVVFINHPGVQIPRPGIYLIPHEALKNDRPEAELLRQSDGISHVRWAPDSEHIVFHLDGGNVRTYNTILKEGAKGITHDGYFPVYSPDGDRLAFAHRFIGMNTAISVISLQNHRPGRRLVTVAPIDHVSSSHFIWAPDGQAIIYTVKGFDRLFHSYRAPLDGGPHEEIFEHLAESPYDFDWTGASDPHAVEPTRKLTTLWGSLKRHNTPRR